MTQREQYGFSEWPDEQIESRYMELTHLQELPHEYKDRVKIAHELIHLIFERSDRGLEAPRVLG